MSNIEVQTEIIEEPSLLMSRLSAALGMAAFIAGLLAALGLVAALFMSIHTCLYGVFVDGGVTWDGVIMLWSIVGALILLCSAFFGTSMMLLSRPQLTLLWVLYIFMILACYAGGGLCAYSALSSFL